MKIKKLLLCLLVIFLYISQISICVAVGIVMAGIENTIASNILILIALISEIIAIIGGVANIVYALTTKKCEENYKSTMIVKLALVPYFVVNFIISFCLICGLLNPFLIWSMMIFLPIMLIFTFGVMFSTSVYNISFLVKQLIKKEKKLKDVIVHIIFQLIFIFDVVDSVILYVQDKN